jgi:hypothetical protein
MIDRNYDYVRTDKHKELWEAEGFNETRPPRPQPAPPSREEMITQLNTYVQGLTDERIRELLERMERHD